MPRLPPDLHLIPRQSIPAAVSPLGDVAPLLLSSSSSSQSPTSSTGINAGNTSSQNGGNNKLDCKICQETFAATGLRTPRLLLCGHTFCEACLVKLLADSHIVCPYDRKVTYVPLGGVVELSKNFAFLEVLELLAVGGGAAAESGLSACGIDALGDSSIQTYVAKCDENEQHVATLYCLTCTTNLCAPCADAIHSTKTLSRHERIPLGKAPRQSPQCSLHPGHPVELICLEPACRSLSTSQNPPQPMMCYLCRDFSSHKGHKFTLLRTEAEAVKSLVNDCLESVRSLSDDVTNCVRQISVCLQHIEGTTSRADRDETRSIRGTALVARQQVHDYFEDLRHSLRRQEEVALSVVNTFVREKKCALQESIETLTMILSRVTSIEANLEKKATLPDVDLIIRRGDIGKLIEASKLPQVQFQELIASTNVSASCDPSVPVSFTRDNRVHIGPKIEMRLVMLGLNNAGKTSILFKLKQNEFVATIPTIGFNVETIEFKNLQFNMWDVGGDPKLRPLWKHYYLSTQALIFVVDSADRSRLAEAHGELSRLMLEKDLKGAILLVLANKQDNRHALGVEALTQELNLHKVCCGRKWHIQACDAQTGVGLEDGLDWLSRQLAWAGVVDVCQASSSGFGSAAAVFNSSTAVQIGSTAQTTLNAAHGTSAPTQTQIYPPQPTAANYTNISPSAPSVNLTSESMDHPTDESLLAIVSASSSDPTSATVIPSSAFEAAILSNALSSTNSEHIFDQSIDNEELISATTALLSNSNHATNNLNQNR